MAENTLTDTEFESLLKMSRLDVSNCEKQELKQQISSILNYFAILSQYDTSSVETDFSSAVLPHELRDDTKQVGLEYKDLKQCINKFLDGYVAVPKILEGGE